MDTDDDQRASYEAYLDTDGNNANIANRSPMTTTISTIVVNSGSFQLVVALLQSGDIYNIKVIEMEPKLTLIGLNLDEALLMQKEHDEMLRRIQEHNTPLEELDKKIQELIIKENPRHEILAAMTSSMELTWSDVSKMLLERKFILDQNVNFHEKFEECRAKMSALEMSCRDTMIPIEIESVLEYLEKFKQLRTDVLTSVMSALKEGSSLIDRLKRLLEIGSVDSRPDYIKTETMKAVHQVEVLLEELHDKRNSLELAWQTRKTQLEQCYALAVLAKDMIELSDLIERRRNEILNTFSLGDSETTTNLLLKTYTTAREDAIGLRDKALKITKATENLVLTGCFAGDEASQKAYSVLANATDYFDEIERREHLLEEAKEFFVKAEKVLAQLEKLEIEVSTTKFSSDSDEVKRIHERVLQEIDGLIDDPVRRGNHLLETVNYKHPESAGIKRTVEEMENRKIYLENVCSPNSEQKLQITHALNLFMEKYNDILSWLVSIAEIFLRTNRDMGENANDGNVFLNLHHQLLADLEIKGNDVNNLLLTLPPLLEHLDDNQRKDIDKKVDSLHHHWTELKRLVETRVDLVSIYINFHKNAVNINEMFDFAEDLLKTVPEDEKLNQFEMVWNKIKPIYEQLKELGNQFVKEASRVADPYLETKNPSQCVDEILNSISNRQFNITECWENWNSSITTKRETELIIENIMTENVRVLSAASKLDAELYPVLNFPTDNLIELRTYVIKKLESVLSEISKAQNEIRKRIETTRNVQTVDNETFDQILQMKNNLETIDNKLDDITSDYKKLLEMIGEYLQDLADLKIRIENYFNDKDFVPSENIEKVYNDFNVFKDTTMERFRSLISQSQMLVERIRHQEPSGASEFDAERIISLLENLRIVFETQNKKAESVFEKQQKWTQFITEMNAISKNIDDMWRQLNDVKTQYGESPAAAKATSIAFEYFEQTVELLQERIKNLVNSSENVIAEYPEKEQIIRSDVDNLNRKWDEFREKAKNTRKLINLANEYFNFYDHVDAQYRRHSTFHYNTVNKLPHISTVAKAAEIIDSINHYVAEHERPQMNDLRKLSHLSQQTFGHDQSTQLYSDNVVLFESFAKLRTDISSIIEKFKTVESENIQKSTVDEPDQTVTIQQQQQLISKSPLPQIFEHNLTTINNVIHETTIKKIESKVTEHIQDLPNQITYEPPSFVQPLRNVSIQEGDKLTYQCYVTGNPEPKIEWFKDGMSIQNNTDYRTTYDHGLCTLSIDETFAEDSACFKCKASNSVGVAETTATLSVKEAARENQLEAPKFIKYLNSGKAVEGESFQFHCIVTGNPLPDVQWYKSNECIDTLPDYVITFNNGEAILNFDKVKVNDRARFTCVASNPLGTEQTEAYLEVTSREPTEPPQFLQILSNVMARVGQKIKLECNVTGLPRPEIYWTHNGKSFNARDSKLQYENQRATLVINEAFLKDAGVYIATAKNSAGEVSSACNVIVKGRLPNETSDSEMASDMEPVKPYVQLPLKDISIVEGQSVRLDCIIVGQPEPEVIWYHNGRPVKESDDFQLLFQGDRCSLLIREAYSEDTGNYCVVAINSAGEASSRCNLSVITNNQLEPAIRNNQPTERIIPVEYPPQFEKLLSDILAPEGERIEFECSLVGDPKPDVRWYLNNKLIDGDDVRMHQVHDDNGTVKLIIENVTHNDKGLYTVKASNPSGEAKCFSHLIVKSVNAPDNNYNQPQNEIEEKLVSPTFKELFTNKIAHENECTKFECIVIGKPQPKIKWYYNDELVHGKDFLISTSGERQVLTIPEVNKDTAGKISCVAENDAGKATCVAFLSLIPESNVPQDLSEMHSQSMTEEHNTGASVVTIKKQTFTSTSTSHVSSTNVENGIPQTQIHQTVKHDQSLNQFGGNVQQVTESKQYQEYHQSDNLPPVVQHKSTVTVTKNIIPQQGNAIIEATIPKPKRKSIAPRFVSPFVGKIVDQGADIVFEAILDGFPSPEVKVQKNGEDLFANDQINISHAFNKVVVELKNVGIKDAGRYTCVAQNDAGSSSSTADLVVKKSIFPPVFGRRLQAQVVKKGERVIMEVEITGTPEPTVTWYKNGQPINEVMSTGYKIKQLGIGHQLVLESAKVTDTGKYMVRAINSGGEAQSIADFAVLEPTPERMVEVVKTVVFDDLNIIEPTKSISISLDKSKEMELSNVTPIHPPSSTSNFSSHQQTIHESDSHANEESTTITETTRTTEATMRMEHKLTFPELTLISTTTPIKTDQIVQTAITPTISEGTMVETSVKTTATNTDQHQIKHDSTQTPPQPPPKPVQILFETKPIFIERPIVEETQSKEEQSTIETQSISKQTAFDFFMNKIKAQPEEGDEAKPYTKYENISKESTQEKISFTPMQFMTENHIVHEIPVTRDTTDSTDLKTMNLERGPEPEFGFMPKEEDYKQESVADKIQRINEENKPKEQTSTVCPPFKPFNYMDNKTEVTNEYHSTETHQHQYSSQTEVVVGEPIYRPQAFPKVPEKLIDIRCSSPRPSAEGVAMEKLWATQKTTDLGRLVHPEPTVERIVPIVPQETILKAPMLIKNLTTQKENDQITSIIHEVQLEPGTPPEICFAPKLVEISKPPERTVELVAETKLPAPPLPPREVKTEAPPVPTKPIVVQHPIQVTPPVTNGRPVVQPRHQSSYTESDYESDYASRTYRSVKPPTPTRPRSVENTPQQQQQNPTPTFEPATTPSMTPSQFISTTTPQPRQQYSGYMADTEEPIYHNNFTESYQSTTENYSTSYQQDSQMNQSPFQQPPIISEQKSIPPAKHYRHHIHKNVKKDESSGNYMKESTTTTTSMMKNISMTSKQFKYNQEPELEPLPFKPDPPRPKPSMKGPPPPSPSKFIKGEFRESDYESDYDSRIQPIWRPNDSDSEPIHYKPVRPILTPTGRRSYHSDGGKSVTPPSEFDQVPQFEGPPRPKFEPIEKPRVNVKFDQTHIPKQPQPVFKPTPVQVKPNQFAKQMSEPPTKEVRYYTAIAGAPIHTSNRFATETSNSMHMKESTESSHRIVNITQTRRVIPLDGFIEHQHQQEQKLEPFPYEVEPGRYTPRQRLPPPPTPTKFVRGEFRESDYESEVESAKIRPVWTPNSFDNGEPRYRRVNPPRPSRATSLPRTNNYGRIVSPLEFDTQPPTFVNTPSTNGQTYHTRTQTIDRYSTKKYHTINQTRDDIDIKPGSPPKYGYIEGAHQQMQNMNQTFKTKAQHFIEDISNVNTKHHQQHQNVYQHQKPILKKTVSDSGGENNAYREESRVSQYGTKHIDPNTGLIYFKYDFGYEFGILFPGEGKKFIGGMKNGSNESALSMTSQRALPAVTTVNHRRTGDIPVPVYHEKTNNRTNQQPPPTYRHSTYVPPTNTESDYYSEPEFEQRNKRYSLPIDLNIDRLHKPNEFLPQKQEHQKSQSPMMINTSNRSAPSTPVNSHQNDGPKRPPIFITPLKDIAVVCGQTARFECIVQCDPHPQVYWTRNGAQIQNNYEYMIEFRNGVCRLTIPQAYPAHAGTYTCIATNRLGSVKTASDLLVPDEKWGVRK